MMTTALQTLNDRLLKTRGKLGGTFTAAFISTKNDLTDKDTNSVSTTIKAASKRNTEFDASSLLFNDKTRLFGCLYSKASRVKISLGYPRNSIQNLSETGNWSKMVCLVGPRWSSGTSPRHIFCRFDNLTVLMTFFSRCLP